MAFPPIETRQRMFRDQRDAELRKLADTFQARQKKLQSVRDDDAKFLQESRAEEMAPVRQPPNQCAGGGANRRSAVLGASRR